MLQKYDRLAVLDGAIANHLQSVFEDLTRCAVCVEEPGAGFDQETIGAVTQELRRLSKRMLTRLSNTPDRYRIAEGSQFQMPRSITAFPDSAGEYSTVTESLIWYMGGLDPVLSRKRTLLPARSV